MRHLLTTSALFTVFAASGCGSIVPSSDPDASTAQPLAIVTSSLAAANRQIPYEAALEATGGSPPYSWAAVDTPDGLQVGRQGSMTGTPTAPGDYVLTVTVTDSLEASETASIPFTVENEPFIVLEELPDLHVFRWYEIDVEVLGGAEPYRFSASGLPPDFVLNEDSGRLSNNPEAPAITDTSAARVTITVTDANGATHAVARDLNTIGVDSVRAGLAFSCALDQRGAVHCWGFNDNGQIGQEDAGSYATPVEVEAEQVFTALDTGFRHACALDEEGAAWCWGDNRSNQLGDADAGEQRHVPRPVGDGHEFHAISTEQDHTCALDDAGAAWCWGLNADGQLGNESVGGSSARPVQVVGGRQFASIAAGHHHSCALEEDGTAWCWGSNADGQLGTGETNAGSAVPVRVSGGHQFASITAGVAHTCGRLDGVDVLCWGSNTLGQNGTGSDEPSLSPESVAGGHAFVAVSAGAAHTCAIDDDSRPWCWGHENVFGGGVNYGNAPSQVAAGEGLRFAAISVASHTCALDAGAAVAWCWGGNRRGQLGNGESGTGERSDVPVRVHPTP